MGISPMPVFLILCGPGLALFAQPPADMPTREIYSRSADPSARTSLNAFRLGETFMAQRNYQSAANEFRNALNGDRQPSWVVVWSHVNLGRIFSRTGQHERAVSAYQAAVRANDNTGGALDEAIQFLKAAGSDIPQPDPVPVPTLPGVSPPQPVDRVPSPEYTEEALTAELEGTVLITATVGTDGRARDPQVTRQLGLGLDEKALEAVREWRFRPGAYSGIQTEMKTFLSVDFSLPSKHSRWHLVRVTFRSPDGVERPRVRGVFYPPGAGISRASIEHAQIVVAMQRQATATVSFNVNEEGRPTDFKIEAASDDLWGPEAISILDAWRFAPATKDGVPVPVPCTVTMAWGPRTMEAHTLRGIADRSPH